MHKWMINSSQQQVDFSIWTQNPKTLIALCDIIYFAKWDGAYYATLRYKVNGSVERIHKHNYNRPNAICCALLPLWHARKTEVKQQCSKALFLSGHDLSSFSQVSRPPSVICSSMYDCTVMVHYFTHDLTSPLCRSRGTCDLESHLQQLRPLQLRKHLLQSADFLFGFLVVVLLRFYTVRCLFIGIPTEKREKERLRTDIASK